MDTINMESFLSMLESTNTPVNVDPMVQAWLFELKHRESFHVAITDLSDPYNKAMPTFQAFTTSIIDGLERGDAEVVGLIDGDNLKTLYSGHPTFEVESFRWWVKDAILKHPKRRWPKQAEFVLILQLQGVANSNIENKVHTALEFTKEFIERLKDPRSLVRDPDVLYFFRNKNGIVETELTPDSEDGVACPVCTADFDQTLTTHRAPCGHIMCRPCLDRWVRECKGTYTCSMCRACLICSTNKCKHHIIHQDIAPPIPMPMILDCVAPGRVGEELHGIRPDQYWQLRELTRDVRALLAFLTRQMESATFTEGDPVFKHYVKKAEQLLGSITKAFEAAAKEGAV
jgi:hypothetical protein